MADRLRSPAAIRAQYGMDVIFLCHPAAIGVRWETDEEDDWPADLPDLGRHATGVEAAEAPNSEVYAVTLDDREPDERAMPLAGDTATEPLVLDLCPEPAEFAGAHGFDAGDIEETDRPGGNMAQLAEIGPVHGPPSDADAVAAAHDAQADQPAGPVKLQSIGRTAAPSAAPQPRPRQPRSLSPGFAPQVVHSPTRPSRPDTTQKGAGRRWALFLGAALLIPLLGSLIMLAPLLLAEPPLLGTFSTLDAPITAVRAPSAGRITGLAVHEGQTVTPDTLLLTIHHDAAPNPAAAALRARLTSVQERLAVLDANPSRSGTSDAERAQQADLARRRNAARAEAAQLDDALTALTPQAEQQDTPVRAGLNGTLWSVTVTDGADTVPGAPLVRLVDCDHAFLTVPSGTALHPGQGVNILLNGGPAGIGLVRWAAGPSEPTGSLVVSSDHSIPGAQCQVGARAWLTLRN